MSVCVILGAGGFARETFWHAQQCRGQNFNRFVFVDDINEPTSLSLGGKEWPIEKQWEFQKYCEPNEQIGFVVSIGDPAGKKILVEKALRAGLRPLPTIIHESVIIQDPDCRIGRGGLISPRAVLTTNITLGDYVTLNVGVTLGHDCVLDDYVTCAPGVSVAGNVHLKEGVSLGIGGVIREKTTVAEQVTAGAQACVVEDIAVPGITVVGVPARDLKRT